MLKHWLIDLIGHVSGLSDVQLRQIEKSLPASKALIDLLNRAQPIIEQAQNLYAEAEPLIDQAKKEWQTVGPAAARSLRSRIRFKSLAEIVPRPSRRKVPTRFRTMWCKKPLPRTS